MTFYFVLIRKMDLYLCYYDDTIRNQTLYYFAGGGNFRDIKIHKFTYNGSYYTNDDSNVVFENNEETGEMTFEEMNKYVIGLITKKRITETLEQWNEFKKCWFGDDEDEED